MIRWTSLLVVVGAVGCKAPEPAPEDLGQLTLYLFQYFDSDVGEEEQGLLDLETWMDGLDLEGNLNDRAVAPPVLKGESFGLVTPVDGADPEAQTPVAVAGLSSHDLDGAISIVANDNQVCIESDSTVYYHRTYTTDLDCFVDGSCDRVESTNEVRKETIISDVWYDLDKDWRVVELEDGRKAMIGRSVMPKQYLGDGGNNSLDQTYTYEAWIPGQHGTTKRFYAMWSSVTLSGVGDDTYAALVKSGLDEGYENADTFLDGGSCSNDRDRPYDRP